MPDGGTVRGLAAIVGLGVAVLATAVDGSAFVGLAVAVVALLEVVAALGVVVDGAANGRGKPETVELAEPPVVAAVEYGNSGGALRPGSARAIALDG